MIDFKYIKKLKDILYQNQYKKKKYLGQHFLFDKNILKKIVEKADLTKDDVVLEIGPGIGTLTLALSQAAGRVIALERDRDLYEFLKKYMDEYGIENIDLRHTDALKFSIENLPEKYKIVANIPFKITSPLLWKYLLSSRSPESMTLMVQKEVAERIVSPPGQMSLLAVLCQYRSDVKLEFYVKRGSFSPPPRVDSAVVKFLVKDKCADVDERIFFDLVKKCFTQKRKLLVSTISRITRHKKEDIKNIFNLLNIPENSRPQDLSVNDWIKLYKKGII